MRTTLTSLAVASALVLVPASAQATGDSALTRPLVPAAAAVPASVSAVAAAPFGARALGSSVAVTIVDAASGSVVFSKRGLAPVAPASTLKLVTALTALSVLPPDATLATELVTSGTRSGGSLEGDLVLVGGGDPTLSSLDTAAYPAPARMSGLVDQLRRKGIKTVTGRLLVDTSAYAGPRIEAGWKPSYITEGSVAPVSALMVDGGRARATSSRGARSAQPEFAAGRRLLAMLKSAGIVVSGGVAAGVAAASAAELAIVRSAPVPALIERMLQHSDNDLAEALLRRVAIQRGRPPTFAGGAAVALETLSALGLPMAGVVLRDGSGLSRSDRVTTDLLAGVLRLATTASHPELRPMLSGLPVAGFNGTLAGRYRDRVTRSVAGRVRAKTGTLNNVTALAGVIVSESGQLLVFAAAADHVPSPAVSGAARLLDRAVAVVGHCGCR